MPYFGQFYCNNNQHKLFRMISIIEDCRFNPNINSLFFDFQAILASWSVTHVR